MKRETEIQIINKAWINFNAKLNQGLEWDEAKDAALDEAITKKIEFDNNFEVDPTDPQKSEAVWDVRMDQFNYLINTIRQI